MAYKLSQSRGNCLAHTVLFNEQYFGGSDNGIKGLSELNLTKSKGEDFSIRTAFLSRWQVKPSRV